jgi:hypothetical protein
VLVLLSLLLSLGRAVAKAVKEAPSGRLMDGKLAPFDCPLVSGGSPHWIIREVYRREGEGGGGGRAALIH